VKEGAEEANEAVELWGFHTADVEEARAVVERVLGVPMTLHESEAIGPYYHVSFCSSHADLTLRANLDADFDPDVDDPDEALEEPDFPDFGTLLYVEWHGSSHGCRRAVEGLAPEAQLLVVE
jgi:hypothetical protein